MGMSIWHLLILFFIILLIFGPQRLEGIGISLGRAVRGFKKGLEGEEETSTTQVTIKKTEEVKKDNTPV